MNERFDHIVVGGGSSGSVAAARLVNEGRRVLLLEGGYSHRHPLLDMPPGIFKMINGSKYMRYHHTVPQDHLDGRVHDIPQANVLGGGSSVNAQVYMRGRPSDYDEWHEMLRGENDYPGWSWSDVLPHFRTMEGNNRFYNELHGADGPLLVSDPGHINDMSRWFVQAIQAIVWKTPENDPLRPLQSGRFQPIIPMWQCSEAASEQDRRDRSVRTGGTMKGPKDDALLTPAEVAALFRVDPKTVTRWAKAGKLSSIRTLGGHRRYRADEVRKFLEGAGKKLEG